MKRNRDFTQFKRNFWIDNVKCFLRDALIWFGIFVVIGITVYLLSSRHNTNISVAQVILVSLGLSLLLSAIDRIITTKRVWAEYKRISFSIKVFGLNGKKDKKENKAP